MKFLLTFFILSLALSSCAHNERLPLVDLGKKQERNEHEAFGDKVMISTQGKYASQIGLDVFKAGGNIVDVATAISFALAVERPQSTGVGGGGFTLYYSPSMKEPQAIDFREKAPLKTHNKIYLGEKETVLKEKQHQGIFSAGVPGMVAGVLDMHKKHGKLPLKQLLEPAIKLAEEGFEVYPELADALEKKKDLLANYPASKTIFFKGDRPLKEGEVLVQKDLANTLKAIVQGGKKAFYEGHIAQAIVSESERLQGPMSLDDFKKYNVVYRKPIKGSFKGHTLFSMSPPSAGGTHLVQILNILEKDDLKSYGPFHYQTLHLTASAMQAAYADREAHMGDADFSDVPLEIITSKKYASDLRWRIPESTALKQAHVSAADVKLHRKDRSGEVYFYDRKKSSEEKSNTTHFSIMDKEGNVISSTQTINGAFGSGVVVPGTGILLNNEMGDFAPKITGVNFLGMGTPLGKNNLVEAQKRPLSSMAPTIIFKNNRPLLALGSPDGKRIISCLALTTLNYLEHGLPLYESVALGRYHHQWEPDEIRFEPDAPISRQVKRRIFEMGHNITSKKRLACRVQAVALEGDKLHGVSDPRGRGMSVGL